MFNFNKLIMLLAAIMIGTLRFITSPLEIYEDLGLSWGPQSCVME